mgnify:CR=1 FL=1
MKGRAALLVHGSTLAIGATGVVWAWMRYLYDAGPEPDDPEFLLEWTGSHAAEPVVRTLHLVAAPVAIFAIGLLWATHIAPRLFRPWARRVTGASLVALFGPMVLSGVLLQTAATPEQRTLWAWVHGLSSTVWLFGYLVHQLRPKARHAGPGA